MKKSDIQIMASNTVDAIIEQGNIIEMADLLSCLEQWVKDVKAHNLFIPALHDELEKNGKSVIRPSGAKIELAEVGTKYDYSKTNDFVLPLLYKLVEEVTGNIKTREGFLKKFPIEGIELIDAQTGELVKVYPPSKSSSSSYKVTLAK